MVKQRHQIIPPRTGKDQHPTIECLTSDSLVAYNEAVTCMEKRVGEILDNQVRELIWLLEHPSLYTRGTSASVADLLCPDPPARI